MEKNHQTHAKTRSSSQQAETLSDPPALPVDYYLSNFLLMAEYAFKRYRHFFEVESELIETFFALPSHDQAFFVRLFNRKGLLFRLKKLTYPEIPALEERLSVLEEAGLVATNTEAIPVKDLLGCLGVTELKGILTSLGVKPPARKLELIAALSEALLEDRSPLEALGTWIVASAKPLFNLLMTLFFCNRRQTMSDFVVVDLGHVRYENYPVDEINLFFNTREHLDQYLHWGHQKDLFHEVCNARDRDAMIRVHEELKAYWRPDVPWNRAIYKMMFMACSAFEQTKDWAKANEAYRWLLNCEYSFRVAARHVHCLEKEGFHEQALAACRRMLEDETKPSRQLFFRFHIHKNEKALKLPPTAFPKMKKPETILIEAEKISGQTPGKAIYMVGDQSMTVEETALTHYRGLGWSGRFAENGYIRTLAAIFCWDEIFAPIPGVFQNPYQFGPLDLFSDRFYPKRKALFGRRVRELAALKPAALCGLFQTRFAEKQMINAGLSDAARYTPDDFIPFIKAAGVPRLTALIHRFFSAWPETRRGFPDLVLWKDDQLMLIEVKGPGDTVSEPQKVWHDLLLEQGFPVVLLKVQLKAVEAD